MNNRRITERDILVVKSQRGRGKETETETWQKKNIDGNSNSSLSSASQPLTSLLWQLLCDWLVFQIWRTVYIHPQHKFSFSISPGRFNTSLSSKSWPISVFCPQPVAAFTTLYWKWCGHYRSTQFRHPNGKLDYETPWLTKLTSLRTEPVFTAHWVHTFSLIIQFSSCQDSSQCSV